MTKNMKPHVLASLVTSLAILAPVYGVEDPPANLDSKALDEMAPLVAGNTEFALNFLRELPADKNVFFSPFGISEALAVCFSGAEGETAAQMAKVLGFPNEGSEVHEEFKLLHLVQESLEQSEQIDYAMANSLWSKIPLLQSYLEFSERAYGAELFKIDDPGASLAQMDAWVKENTNGKGSNPITPGMMNDPLMKLVILNAIYMDARWKIPFKKSSTRYRPFTLLDGTEVQVPTMYQGSFFRYGRWEDLEVLELPYKGDDVSIYFLLPEKADAQAEHEHQDPDNAKKSRTLAEIEASITAGDLRDSMRCAEYKSVRVFMPKISMQSELDFGYMLQRMGMTDAFSETTANFAGMTGSRLLKIDKALQNARIDIDEVGTKAAVVTAATMGPTSSVRGKKDLEIEWIEYRADRPFLFVVQENLSGTVLFMGRVVDPRISK